MNAYRTLKNRAEKEYEVQKSRFVGSAAPVSDVEGALKFLDEIKRENRSASHNCFAYIIGHNRGIIRYGDDGEPLGTAGKPIVEVMMAKDVTDCAVVITRYFGGILLGTGGLARAYAHTTSLALNTAGVCTMHETGRWHLQIAYPLWDKVDYAIKSLPVKIESTEYAEHVNISMLCRVNTEMFVIEELMKATDGKIETSKDENTFYHLWDE